MKEVIAENNIVLERFNKENQQHLGMAQRFKHDEGINEFFPEWEDITARSIGDLDNTFYSYVVFMDNTAIGICTLVFNSDERVVYSQGFLPEHRGKGYAKMIREVVKKALQEIGVKELVGYIKNNNERSIGAVAKTGVEFTPVEGTDLLEVVHHIGEERKF